MAAACGGGARPGALTPAPASPLAVHSADSLGHALARQTKDSAADQAVLDTLRSGVRHDSAASHDSLPNVRGEEVVGEAERLFGPEGRQVVGAAQGPTFDIDVTSFSTNRRVLQYLEFFQVDARDRFEIWLSRLGRYQGMIRERLRARGLPEDLLYLTLIESGLSNTAVSRARPGRRACTASRWTRGWTSVAIPTAPRTPPRTISAIWWSVWAACTSRPRRTTPVPAALSGASAACPAIRTRSAI
jgi:hypothetical protein